MIFELFVFSLVVGFFALVIFLVIRGEKKRLEELQAAASKLGLAVAKGSWHEDVLQFAGKIDAMPRGNSRRAKFIVSGQYKGFPVRVFQYIYQTGSGKNQTTHRNTVAWAEIPAVWPKLTIVPENLGHKVFDALGGDDIDFESDEFSRRFWVRSPDRKFAYDVIHGRMMEHLMSPGWDRWEFSSGRIVLWKTNNVLRGDQLQPALERLLRLIELIPAYLRPTTVPGPGQPVVAT